MVEKPHLSHLALASEHLQVRNEMKLFELPLRFIVCVFQYQELITSWGKCILSLGFLDRYSLHWIQIHLLLTLRSLLQPLGLSRMNRIHFPCDNSSNIWKNLSCKPPFPPSPSCLSVLSVKLNNPERTVICEREARTLTSIIEEIHSSLWGTLKIYFLIFILLELISLGILIAPLPLSVLEYNSYESKHLNSSKFANSQNVYIHLGLLILYYYVHGRFSKTERMDAHSMHKHKGFISSST